MHFDLIPTFRASEHEYDLLSLPLSRLRSFLFFPQNLFKLGVCSDYSGEVMIERRGESLSILWSLGGG